MGRRPVNSKIPLYKSDDIVQNIALTVLLKTKATAKKWTEGVWCLDYKYEEEGEGVRDCYVAIDNVDAHSTMWSRLIHGAVKHTQLMLFSEYFASGSDNGSSQLTDLEGE
jgi:hypothetical protein